MTLKKHFFFKLFAKLFYVSEIPHFLVFSRNLLSQFLHQSHNLWGSVLLMSWSLKPRWPNKISEYNWLSLLQKILKKSTITHWKCSVFCMARWLEIYITNNHKTYVNSQKTIWENNTIDKMFCSRLTCKIITSALY